MMTRSRQRRLLSLRSHDGLSILVLLLCAGLVAGCGSEAPPSQMERPAWQRAAAYADSARGDTVRFGPGGSGQPGTGHARVGASGGEASGSDTATAMAVAAASAPVVPESVPVRIHLEGPAATREAQLSGLTWWGDRLILLPQYPDFEADQSPAVYAIPRAELEAALSGSPTDTVRVRPERLAVEAGTLAALSGYQGCEALVIQEGRAFATVEAVGRTGGWLGMRAYIGAGTADSTAQPGLSFSQTNSLPVPTTLNNMAFEALVVQDGTVIALYEANGGNVNPDPVAVRMTQNLTPLEPLPMPALEYRLTDATSVDSLGRFWVTNYLYRGEAAAMNPAPDSVALENGVGASHRDRIVVERLVELQITPTRIRRTRTPPVWLQLEGGTGRNWEGVVRFGDGFLLATDTFPETLLAYVPRRVATAAGAPQNGSGDGRADHSRTATSTTSGR